MVSVSGPRSWASPIVRSATWIWGGRSNWVCGVILCSSSAPATVKALKVEPGSKAEPTARFSSAPLGAAARSLGSTRGQLAMARIAPLRGSITSAVAPLGLWSRPTWLSTASVRSCSAASMVSFRSSPGLARLVSARLTVWPVASLTSLRLPSVPCSSFSYSCSRPERPVLSVPTAPISWPASAPWG